MLQPRFEAIVDPLLLQALKEALRVQIHTQIVIERGEDFLKTDRSVGGLPAQSIRRPNHVPRSHPTTSQQC